MIKLDGQKFQYRYFKCCQIIGAYQSVAEKSRLIIKRKQAGVYIVTIEKKENKWKSSSIIVGYQLKT